MARPARRTLTRRLLALPLSQKGRLVWLLVRDRRTGLLPKLALLGLAAYLASPIDLLPDFVPLAGQLDDALVALLVLVALRLLVPRQVLEEHLDRLEREVSHIRP
ncbi:MAG TPA: DUF1232 domain-containing protein [Dehalococcoidia bacterium]|nr:DUF1232 domain-containing protein [Dehalococcoidia bacterium]